MEAPPPARMPVDRSPVHQAGRGGAREESNRRARLFFGESCFISFLAGREYRWDRGYSEENSASGGVPGGRGDRVGPVPFRCVPVPPCPTLRYHPDPPETLQ